MNARIASVHFDKMVATRQYRAAPYRLDAVKVGAEPCIIEIGVERQIERGGFSTSSMAKTRSVHKYIIEPFDIARDIVNEWAHNGLGMTEGQRPGIWVVRDTLPELDPETGVQLSDADGKGIARPVTKEEFRKMFAEDLAAYRAADVEYARWCVGEGNRLAQDVRQIQFIPKKYKLAVEHLGMTTEWVKPGAGVLEMKACPYCQSIIPKKSVVCMKCTQVVDTEEFARLENEKMTAVARLQKKAG